MPRAEIAAQLQRTGQWEGELVHTRKNGTRMFVASHWVLHRTEPNQPPVILEMNSDITERRRAEEALREDNRNTDRFLATLAHDLRNPLAAIRNSLTLAQRAGAVTAEGNRATEVIQRQVGVLAQMLDDLLDVERLRHGQIKLQRSRIELRSVIDAALEISRPRVDLNGHRLKIALPDEPIWLDADLTRLAQVISNLLDNAAKYTPRDGNIQLNAQQKGREVVIRVRDSGMGISADMLPKLFDLYAQGHPLPGKTSLGFGVGLALVRQLTELHGGSVAASSDGPGKGSEFVVRLPLASAPSAQK